MSEPTLVTLADDGIDVLFGTRDENLKRIEKAFGVTVSARGSEIRISGESAALAEHLLCDLSDLLARGYPLRPVDVDTAIRVLQEDPDTPLVEFFVGDGILGGLNVFNGLVHYGSRYVAKANQIAYTASRPSQRKFVRGHLCSNEKITDTPRRSPIYPTAAELPNRYILGRKSCHVIEIIYF